MTEQALVIADEYDRRNSIGTALPNIKVNRQHRDVVEDVKQALNHFNNPPQLFRRGGVSVRIRLDEDGQPIIEQISDAAMRLYISKSANLMKSTPDRDVPVCVDN